MQAKLKKNKATNELRQWWWTSFLPRYLNKSNKLQKTNILNNINDSKALQNNALHTKFKPLSNNHNILPKLGPETICSSSEYDCKKAKININ